AGKHGIPIQRTSFRIGSIPEFGVFRRRRREKPSATTKPTSIRRFTWGPPDWRIWTSPSPQRKGAPKSKSNNTETRQKPAKAPATHANTETVTAYVTSI